MRRKAPVCPRTDAKRHSQLLIALSRFGLRPAKSVHSPLASSSAADKTPPSPCKKLRSIPWLSNHPCRFTRPHLGSLVPNLCFCVGSGNLGSKLLTSDAEKQFHRFRI